MTRRPLIQVAGASPLLAQTGTTASANGRIQVGMIGTGAPDGKTIPIGLTLEKQ